MSTPAPENVSSFIDKLLKETDPATIGLRKIIRKKKDELNDYPLRSVSFEEFDNPQVKKRLLSDDEKRILELEKQVNEFNLRMRKQQQESKQAIEDAYNKGKSEGITQGVEKGKAEATVYYKEKIDQIQENVTSFLTKLEQGQRDIFINSDHIMLKLCIEMAKKVISSELSIRKETILNVLKKALCYIADRERLIIRVSSEDFKIVEEKREFWEPINEKLKQVMIETDERVDAGGCIIESNSGSVDARIGVQIAELADLVEKFWAEEKTDTVAEENK